MDAMLGKAGIVAAVGIALLIPTFNALNASYVKDVQPPPWLPTPPTPPDMEPPPNFTPPTGMTPPTNWQGKNPPPVCPPPVMERLADAQRSFDIEPGAQFTRPIPFQVPESSIALVGYVNATGWQAQRIEATLYPPDGGKPWGNFSEYTPNLASPGGPDDESWLLNSYEQTGQQAPPGDWTLRFAADLPIRGHVTTEFAVILACGGLMKP